MKAAEKSKEEDPGIDKGQKKEEEEILVERKKEVVNPL